MQQEGATELNNPEFAQSLNILRTYQQQQKNQPQQQMNLQQQSQHQKTIQVQQQACEVHALQQQQQQQQQSAPIQSQLNGINNINNINNNNIINNNINDNVNKVNNNINDNTVNNKLTNATTTTITNSIINNGTYKNNNINNNNDNNTDNDTDNDSSSLQLSQEQLIKLKYQMFAYQLVMRNLPIPSLLIEVLFNPEKLKELVSRDPTDSLIEKIVQESLDYHTRQSTSAPASTATVASSSSSSSSSSATVPYASTYSNSAANHHPPTTTTATTYAFQSSSTSSATSSSAYSSYNNNSSNLHYNTSNSNNHQYQHSNQPHYYNNPYQQQQQQSYIKPPPVNLYSQASRQQRLLIPGVPPMGIDPIIIAKERETFIQTKINHRINELEQFLENKKDDNDNSNNIDNGNDYDDSISNNYGNGYDYIDHNMELDNWESLNEYKKAEIELRQLKLRNFQKKVRQDILKYKNQVTLLASSTNRSIYKKLKKKSMRDLKLTERLERQQREDYQKHQKQKHYSFLNRVCNHSREVIQWHRANQSKKLKFGRAVLNYHAQIEKEELKKNDRLSKERLKALKNDDEEAYLKLIDKAKDTRIAHLLEQTNAYLDSLAHAVVAQQHDEVHDNPSVRGGIELMDKDDDTFAIMNGKKIDYYQVAHRIKEEVKQPANLRGGTLKDYQIKGLEWMLSLYNNRLNGILADEMGLGKTIQTISLITYLIEKKNQNGPFLIVVPLSTLTNWTIEFEKWAPSVIKCVYKGTPSARKELQKDYVKHINFQVLLTTYEYIIKDKSVLGKVKWVYVIVDEGHRMKNVNSKLSMILTNNYQCRYRLILTGTPLQNNLPELWSLLNFILPKIFDSVKSFDEWFNTPFANTGGQDKIALNEEESLLIIRRLHKVLRPFLLRRLKKDVESELPDKVERVVKCKLSALQIKLYIQMKKQGVLFVNTGEMGKTGIKGLNNTIMQLRKICNHPFVFDKVEKDLNPQYPIYNNDLLYRVSGKFELLDRILPKFFKTNHRVLIFFQMTSVMTIMEDFLNWRGFRYLRLDGTTKAEDRSGLLERFNTPGSPYFVFLLSTRAGGLGLNLQTADTVIIFDSDWNPHQDLQAQDRAHRIGQTKEVKILRLISQKSIEESILARAQYKLDIDDKVIQAGKFDNKSTAEEREALLRSLLGNENENDEANDVNDEEEMDDDELNELISRNDEEQMLFKQMDIERNQKEEEEWRKKGGKGSKPERLIQESELPPIYLKDYESIMRDEEETTTLLGRGKRARSDVRYDDGLTEKQWMNSLEDDEIDEMKRLETKRRRKEKKSHEKSSEQEQVQMSSSLSSSSSSSLQQQLNISLTPPDTTNDINNNHNNINNTGQIIPKKKRGRPRKPTYN